VRDAPALIAARGLTNRVTVAAGRNCSAAAVAKPSKKDAGAPAPTIDAGADAGAKDAGAIDAGR